MVIPRPGEDLDERSGCDEALAGNLGEAKVLAFAFGLAAEIERTLIGARTRQAFAQRKRAGQQLGRPQGRLSKTTTLTGRDAEIKLLLEKQGAVSAMARIMGVHRRPMVHDSQSRHLAVR